MTKPVLDADGMAMHLTTVSQADWPQLIELWRLQQYAAGQRSLKATYEAQLERDRERLREEGRQEMRAECAECGEPQFAIHHIFFLMPYPAAHKFVPRGEGVDSHSFMDELRDILAQHDVDPKKAMLYAVSALDARIRSLEAPRPSEPDYWDGLGE